MTGSVGRVLGSLAEGMSFSGDESRLNPMRYIPTPMGTKLWQEKTPIARYQEEELYGTRMRRWERPLHDFLSPYLRGAIHRITGVNLVPEEIEEKRDINTLGDILRYMRAVQGEGGFQASRTNIGANLLGAPSYVASTLPRREQLYFPSFLAETDEDKRRKILDSVSTETARSLEAQWVKQDAEIAAAEGKQLPPLAEGGRLLNKEDLAEYKQAKTDLSYANYVRSREIAEFFNRTGYHLPEPGSAAYNPDIDYEDVKVKLVMQEGYNLHDFNMFDDRTNLLWRKPYLDGAIRELTSGGSNSVENIRRTVESIMLSSKSGDPRVVATWEGS